MKRKRKEWRCYFCDEVFKTRSAAWYHFGDEGCTSDVPACVDPLRKDEKARMKEIRDLREWGMQMQRDLERAEDDASMLSHYQGEIRRLFGKGDRFSPSTPHQAWLKLEAAMNETEAWRLRAESYRESLQSAGLQIPLMEWENCLYE